MPGYRLIRRARYDIEAGVLRKELYRLDGGAGELRHLRPGQIVHLQGYLVDVRGSADSRGTLH